MNKTTVLLIVYKERDEEIFTHIKNLIEEDDDINGESIVGTKDGTVKVFKCEETVWRKHCKAGREKALADKVLFVGETNSDNLNIIDYRKYGLFYGKIDDKHYALRLEGFHEWKDGEYDEFFSEYEGLMKEREKTITKLENIANRSEKKKGIGLIGGITAGVLFPPYFVAANCVKISNKIKNDNELRRQQLMFGITKLYYDKLAEFVES